MVVAPQWWWEIGRDGIIAAAVPFIVLGGAFGCTDFHPLGMGCNCRGLQFLDGGWVLLVFFCLATALARVAGHLGVCGGGPWFFGCLHPCRSGWVWICWWQIRFCRIFRELGRFVFGFGGKDGSKGL